MARGIAEEFGRETPKVPVSLLIYLDAIYIAGLFPRNISDNVERVVNYMSEHTNRGLAELKLLKKIVRVHIIKIMGLVSYPYGVN